MKEPSEGPKITKIYTTNSSGCLCIFADLQDKEGLFVRFFTWPVLL